jgi:hypothetical protein
MLKRCVLFGVLALLAACTHNKRSMKPAPTSVGYKTQQSKNLASFESVDVEGVINVNLHTGYKKPRIILHGDTRDLIQVRSFVKHRTLYLVLGNGFPQFGPVTADVQGYQLRKLRYKGAGSIRGNRIHSSSLDLDINNQGTTQLAGDMVLNELRITNSGLVQLSGIRSPRLRVTIKGNSRVELQGVAYIARLSIDGNASLSLYWLRGQSLHVKAKKGATLQLAGVVDRLEVELWDKSRFKGRYLRARRAFVKTHGKSVAEIMALHHQSSLSTDASDIYYYRVPKKTRADFMAMDGSTLNMQEWFEYDEHPITRYNKQFP